MAFTYRGLTASFSRHAVTDSEVEQHLQRLRQQTPRIEEVTDRPTQRGDEVVLDYAGFCDGEQFPGGTAERQTLTLGSGAFIPGFEEQLLDKVPGEEVVVKVTFPAEYHAPELAGKDAEFRCKIHQIRIKSTYALDDTFAKEFGNFENLEQMRQELKKSLQAYSDERGEMDLQDRLLHQAALTLDYTVDPNELEDAVEQQLQNMQAQLAQQGLSLEMYCSFMNITKEDLHKDAYPAAEAALRNQAAVDEIIRLEKLEASEQELGEAVALICRQNNMTVEQLKPYYDQQFEAAVRRSVLTMKAMRLIREQAVLTEK
ncbi:MAG: trigger factor [Ruminococcaceae bacterium]|nr:trigger factor [Oscillospiraceae bacterium]